jgi:hypothetical protein
VGGWQDPDARPLADLQAWLGAVRDAPPRPLEPAEVEHQAIAWLLDRERG